MPLMLVILALLSGIAPAAPRADEFPHAVAKRGCTQEDVPAIEIYLTRHPYDGRGLPRPPYLHIEVAWSDWDALAGARLELVPLNRHGVDPRRTLVRAEMALDGDRNVWLRGTITLGKVDVGRRVSGVYRVLDEQERAWNGAFAAAWVSGPAGCG